VPRDGLSNVLCGHFDAPGRRAGKSHRPNHPGQLKNPWSVVKKDKDSGSSKQHQSIRKRLTGAVLIPSITLLVMWAIVSSYLLFDGFYVRAVAAGVQEVSIPAVRALASAQKERQLSMAYLGRSGGSLTELHVQQQQTDDALRSMRSAMNDIMSNAPAAVVDRVQKLNAALDQLPQIRSRVDSGGIDRNQVYTYYNNLLDTATGLFDTQARIVPDVTATQGAIAATSLFRSADLMSRETSVISAAFASGQFSPQDQLAFANLVGSYHSELDKTIPFVRPDVQESYQKLVDSDPWKKLVDEENTLIQHGAWTPRNNSGDLPFSEQQWQDNTNQVADELVKITIAQADGVSAQALDDGTSKFVSVIIGSVIALLAAIAAIIVAVRVSGALVNRALVTRLEALRKDALELAHERLPDIVVRLRGGDAVDVQHEVPELDYGRDEIGQLADAFNAAQYTAVAAAVKEAQAREGVNNVFLGIAHRNQGLVHRQLKILDRMEREEESPEQLEGLFQLDHLATRARRNAENLIILGGGQPGRRWRKPVLLVDVLRSAISETEQYFRVRAQRIPNVAVTGSAVADTIHLVAELVDNATAFSPPRSQVHVHGTVVARGVVVEIEDQGLGMSDEDRERANAMLAEPPEFDAMALRGDSRLGLFVVARLALRLGVKVEFRVSPYGGTRAIVLLPSEILAPDEQVNGRPDETIQLPRQDLRLRGTLVVSDDEPAETADEPAAAGAANGSELDEFWASARATSADAVTQGSGPDDDDEVVPRTMRAEVAGRNVESPETNTRPANGWDSDYPEFPQHDLDLPELPRREPTREPVGEAGLNGSARNGRHAGPTDTGYRLAPVPPSAHRPAEATGVTPVPTATPPVTPPAVVAQVPESDGSASRPKLPQRRPQQNLAPQLLEDNRADLGDLPDPTESARSPEEIRTTMSAFQRGSREGRSAGESFES
jgi:signal transduction histidine kinase